MSKFNTATLYIAIYVLIRNKNTLVFMLRSNTGWMDGYYGLPSGKVEKNESFSAAAIREANEEIGITIAPRHLHYLHKMHRLEGNEWVDVFFEALKWSGKIVNAEPHVHSKLVRLDTNNLPENVIPSVQFALRQINRGTMFSEYGWTNNAQ